MKITIVTATYNSAATLADTLESVLRQDYADFEHIIKDGGSTDQTLAIVEAYAPRYNGRLRVLKGSDSGIYDAMNQGIEAATGDVVGLLNSDDFFTSSDVLSTIAAAFEADSALSAVYADVKYVSAKNTSSIRRYYSSRLFAPRWLRLGFMPAHPSFYCRRSVYAQHGLYDTAYATSADFEMMVRLFGHDHLRSRYINKDFVTMRVGGESSGGWRSKRRVNADVARALKSHGIYSNQLFQSLRYAWRIGEIALTKLRY